MTVKRPHLKQVNEFLTFYVQICDPEVDTRRDIMSTGA
jgi:hypothetical protein